MMTPRERFLAVMRGEITDRVPLELPGFHYASREDLAHVENPRKREIVERVFDQLHFSVDVKNDHNRFLCTPPQRMREEHTTLPNGHRLTHGTIDTPKGELTFDWHVDPDVGTGWMVKYPCETREDIEKIQSVPWERPPDIVPPDMENLPEGFADRGLVTTHLSSPFVCVAAMMKYDTFLEMCATDLEWIRELTEVVLQRELDLLDAVFAEPGIEYVWMGGSEWVTPPMGSPNLYDTLVQGPERAIIERIKSLGNAIAHIHCHGNIRHALPRTIERGGDYTEPVEPPPDGDITLAEAKELARGRIALGGNVEARLLHNENEAAVERASRAAFEGGKRRFVFRPSEGHTPHLPDREYRNWMTAIDVWEELSSLEG